MTLLVSLWLLWLVVWVVFTFVLIKQSRQLLTSLAQHTSFEFKGWRHFLWDIWRRQYQTLSDQSLRENHEEYRKLMVIWLFMALLVILVRLVILVTNV